jgi:hypothetical protein
LAGGMLVQQYAQQTPTYRNERFGYDNILSRYQQSNNKG